MSKILLITHQPISMEGSNGRTLYSYLKQFSKEDLINFYIDGNANDLLASSYFCVNDRMIIRHFFFKSVGEIRFPKPKKSDSTSSYKVGKKTLVKVLCRDLLWRLSRVLNKRLKEWLLDEKPQCIVLQASDFPYLADLAKQISKFLDIPIIVQNTEEYLLKDHDFLSQKVTLFKKIVLKIYQWRLKKSYGELFSDCPVVYLTEELLKAHQKVYPNSRSVWIGNSTSLCPVERKITRISNAYYFGNFGLGRAKSLRSIAKVGTEANLDFRLHCYGNANDAELEELKGPGIEYCGFLPYADLINLIKKDADLVVHAEGEGLYYSLDNRFAFSTKIPDMLALGIPTLFYGSEKFAFVNYLSKNNVRFIARNESELTYCFDRIFSLKPDEYVSIVKNSVDLAKKNHSPQINSIKFKRVVLDAVTDWKK